MPSLASARRRHRVRCIIFGALTALCALAVNANALFNAFTYDDHAVVEGNPAVAGGDLVAAITSPFGPFASSGGAYYRPVTSATYVADRAIWGGGPFGFHLTNVLLHGACSVLVFLLALRLLRHRTGALGAGLLFALHPVHTDAVSSISGRGDVLAAVLVLAALFAHTRTGRFRAPLTGIVALLAFGAKESALVLPLVLLAWDLIWRDQGCRLGAVVPTLARRQAPVALSLGLFLVARTAVTGSPVAPAPSPLDNPLVTAGLKARLFTLPEAGAHYARLLVFPAALSADYGGEVPVSHAPPLSFALGLALLLGAVAARVVLFQCRVGLSAGALLLPMALHLNPVWPGGSLVAERYLYLPSAGFCVALSLVALRFRPDWASRHRRVCWACAALLLAGAAIRTAHRNRDWRNDETLFRAAVRVAPQSVRARLNLAQVCAGKGDFDEALAQLGQAARLRPDYPIVHLMLGDASRRAGRHAEAATHYARAVRMQPRLARAWRGPNAGTADGAVSGGARGSAPGAGPAAMAAIAPSGS